MCKKSRKEKKRIKNETISENSYNLVKGFNMNAVVMKFDDQKDQHLSMAQHSCHSHCGKVV